MTDYRVVEVRDDQLGVAAGTLVVSVTRGAERYRFSYGPEFLQHNDSYDIDPDLPRSVGTPITVPKLFGAFTDAAPDRWGRNLIERACPGRLFESTYLFDVHDPLRQGALRFREDGRWLNPDGTVPRLVNLPALRALARDVVAGDPRQINQAAKELLDVGTSALGGAHPKASVIDEIDRLCIAKLALDAADSRNTRNEYATLLLAAEVGLRTGPEPTLVHGADQAEIALIIPRFDRTANGGRVAYASAKTMLGTPVFDLNPNTNLRTHHSTMLDGQDDVQSIIDGLPAAAEAMRVGQSDACDFLNHVNQAVQDSEWFTADVKDTVKDLHNKAVSAFAG